MPYQTAHNNPEGLFRDILGGGGLAMGDGAFIRKYEFDGGGDPIPKTPLPRTSPAPTAAGSCRLSASFQNAKTLIYIRGAIGVPLR